MLTIHKALGLFLQIINGEPIKMLSLNIIFRVYIPMEIKNLSQKLSIGND